MNFNFDKSKYLYMIEEITHQVYQWSQNMKEMLIQNCKVQQLTAIKSIERMKSFLQIKGLQQKNIDKLNIKVEDQFDFLQNIFFADKFYISNEQLIDRYFRIKEKQKYSIDSVQQQINLIHKPKYKIGQKFIFLGDYDFTQNKISGRYFFVLDPMLIMDFIILEDELLFQIFISNNLEQFGNTFNPVFHQMLQKIKVQVSQAIKYQEQHYAYQL